MILRPGGVRGRCVLYLWKNRASAAAAHGLAWRQRIGDAYRSEPVIRVFETPLVIDNERQPTPVESEMTRDE